MRTWIYADILAAVDAQIALEKSQIWSAVVVQRRGLTTNLLSFLALARSTALFVLMAGFHEPPLYFIIFYCSFQDLAARRSVSFLDEFCNAKFDYAYKIGHDLSPVVVAFSKSLDGPWRHIAIIRFGFSSDPTILDTQRTISASCITQML